CAIGNPATTTGDVLAHNGDATWTNQRDLPAGTYIGGELQPPTIRPEAWVHFGSGVYHKDMGREPLFTVWHDNFDNPPEDRMDGEVLSCNNSNLPNTCSTWREPLGNYARVNVYVDPSFDMIGTDAVHPHEDLQTIMNGWSYA